MSQRGGSVTATSASARWCQLPLVPPGEAVFTWSSWQRREWNGPRLVRPGGVLITPRDIAARALPSRQHNVALLGVLQPPPEIGVEAWW